MRIEWRPKAKQDFFEIVDHISIDNPTAARDILAKIQRRVESLGAHSEMGRVGRVAGTRELVVSRTPYIVIYRLFSCKIMVVRILHGARQWPIKSEQ